jgi:hypothetical protein
VTTDDNSVTQEEPQKKSSSIMLPVKEKTLAGTGMIIANLPMVSTLVLSIVFHC